MAETVPAGNKTGLDDLEDLAARFWADESGATSIEYALIGVVLAIGLMASVPAVKDEIVVIFEKLTGYFQDALTAA